MKQFWLIRHGQSTANIGIPITARGLPPLTELGWEQSHKISAWFPESPDLIVATSFIRAQQTAEPLRSRFPDVAYTEWPAYEYSPLNKKYYTNTSVHERSPKFLEFFENGDPHHSNGEGSETFAAGISRAGDLLDRLHAAPQQKIVVFTHGTFLRMVYWRWLYGSNEAAYETMPAFAHFRKTMRVANCSVIHGRITADGVMMISSPQQVIND